MATRKRSSSAANVDPQSSGTVARCPAGTLRSWTVGALPIINWLLERMKLERILATHLPAQDGRGKLPVARALIILVQNILLAREPLYGIREWAAGREPQLLGLAPEQVGSVNDDRVGRCLGVLFAANRQALILDLIRHVVEEFDVDLDELHNDSTTVSVFGAYAEATKETKHGDKTAPAITWGHSKARRPDLKQLLYILTVSGDGGVPIHCRVASGNVTDDTTHCDNWDMLCQIVGSPDFLYVADSKLATRANLDHIAGRGGRFVSVLPRTRREDGVFRERMTRGEVTWRPIWDKVDDEGNLVDRFSAAEGDEVMPEGYCLYWYRSTRKTDRDMASRSDRLERAGRHLRQLQAKLRSPRSRQRERVKVEARITEILKHYDVADLMRVAVVERPLETYRQKRRGRPGKDTEYVKQVRMRLDLEWIIDAEAVAQAQKTDGIFPLTTNDKAMSSLDTLHAYKRQPTIEKRHEQFKTDFAVAPVWLKDVKRIEGLLHVYFFVLLVESLLERELRQAMARAKLATLPLYPEGRPCACPTARRVIDVFEPVQRHALETPAGATETTVTDLTSLQRRLLRLLEIPAAAYEA